MSRILDKLKQAEAQRARKNAPGSPVKAPDETGAVSQLKLDRNLEPFALRLKEEPIK